VGGDDVFDEAAVDGIAGDAREAERVRLNDRRRHDNEGALRRAADLELCQREPRFEVLLSGPIVFSPNGSRALGSHQKASNLHQF
jgi:hypothetical protein